MEMNCQIVQVVIGRREHEKKHMSLVNGLIALFA